MDRLTLEKAWLDCYDFENLPVSKKVENIAKISSERMAMKVYIASMEMRNKGINWFGSDFEDEFFIIIKKGDSAIENPDRHITVQEYEEIKKAKEQILRGE